MSAASVKRTVKMCVFTMKTMTLCEKTKRLLASFGIYGRVTSVDPSVTRLGCSFGVSVKCSQREEVKRILREAGIPYGDVIGVGGAVSR